MNYFEFYQIAESFAVDLAGLKKTFYELSKRYHPDFYANEAEARQLEILELSTLNNKAFQVLSNPAKRMEYILQLHNLLADGDKYQLAPDFLMDMMDLNESLMEANSKDELARIETQVNEIEKKLDTEKERLIIEYEKVSDSDKEKTLLLIKDIYFRTKYLLRIKDSLATFAARL